MNSIKMMLSGLMIFLMGLFCMVADAQHGTWLGAAGILLPLLGVLLFVIGLCKKADH